MGQGESLATTLDPLVERQSPCRTTSDREPRQEHPRSRQGDLEHSTKKTERDLLVAATGLPPTTAPTHLHPQENRQKASSRYSDMGCTLPLFPGDVRDSMCSPPGGSGTPIPRHSATLPQITMHDECAVASTAFGLACAMR